jgi:hypothetical protein
MRPYKLPTLSSTPVQFLAAQAEIGIIAVYNPNSTTAYLKIYFGEDAPDVENDTPDLAYACPQDLSQHVLFAMVPGPCFVAVADEVGAGDTDPTLALTGTYTR